MVDEDPRPLADLIEAGRFVADRVGETRVPARAAAAAGR